MKNKRITCVTSEYKTDQQFFFIEVRQQWDYIFLEFHNLEGTVGESS